MYGMVSNDQWLFEMLGYDLVVSTLLRRICCSWLQMILWV
jgi:hypothetical protein